MRFRLNHRRLARELAKSRRSQNDWARKLGLGKGHLSLLLRGLRPYPGDETRWKLLEGLDLPFDALFHAELSPERREQRPAGATRRDRRGDATVHALWNDLRLTLRQWGKSPAFCGLAIAILALGLGANITVFGFANALLLRPARFPHGSELVRVYTSSRGSRYSRTSYPNYRDVAEASASLADVAAHSEADVSFSRGGDAESLRAELVSGNFFKVLGLEAARGRWIAPEDDGSAVAVVSHRLASRRFGPEETIVGEKISLNGHPFTVIGIAPEGFQGSHDALRADLWVPLEKYEQVRPRGIPIDRRGWDWLNMTARLEPGVDASRANEEVHSIGLRLAEEYPGSNQGLSFTLVPASALPEQLREGASGFLAVLTVVVALVLLVACMNLASVLLGRTASRRRELAIRQSLGATRGRMLQLALVESLSLALAAGLLALVVSSWTRSALLSLSSELEAFPHFAPQLATDGATLVFTFAVSALTGLALGLVPGLRSGDRGVVDAIRESGGAGVRNHTWQSGFVGAQVAVSLLILIVAGLLVRSLREAETFDPGFRTEGVLLARSTLQRHGYREAKGRAYYRQLRERLLALPGVASATFAAVVPLGLDRESLGAEIEGQEPPEGESAISVPFNVVGPDYFETMGIPILRGRGFEEMDHAAAPRVVIVNETMAKRFWPGQDAVGRYIGLAGDDSKSARIVGVARDIKYYSLGEAPQPYLYVPFSQNYFPDLVFHLGTTLSEPGALAEAATREAEAIDPNVAFSDVMPFGALRRVSLLPNLALAAISTVLGGLTLLLTALGVYGLVSYAVSQRTREIGIRAALGAGRSQLLRESVALGMTSVLFGVAAGLVAASLSTRLVSRYLFGVSAVDPLSFAACATLLTAVALVACFVPAHRAARLDPVQALRHE